MDVNDGVHKPFFWKVNAVKNVLESKDPFYDWVLWIDCDAFFMDPGRLLRIWRCEGRENGESSAIVLS